MAAISSARRRAILVHGVGIHMLGEPLDATSLVALPQPKSSLADGVLHATVAYVNTYGTLALNAPGTTLDALGRPTTVEVTIGESKPFLVPVVQTFGEVPHGEMLLFVDSYGQLSLAMNQARPRGLARLRSARAPQRNDPRHREG